MFELDPALRNDTFYLHKFKLSDLLLMNDKQYPWLILVPRVKGITEIVDLNSEQRNILHEESHLISRMLLESFSAKKLNIAALGNVVSQLHVHHVGRFHNDIAWPRPVWGAVEPKPYTDQEVSQIVEQVRLFISSQ